MTDCSTKIELEQLRLSFTKKLPDYYFLKNVAPYAKKEETFINSYGILPVGLWLELVQVCKKHGIPVQFEDNFNCKIKNCSLSYEEFGNYVADLFKESDMTPMGYQLEGIYNILQYHNCCVEVSTSGGKTLMTYILFKYMRDIMKFQHILYVTPATNLTTQSADKFEQYDFRNMKEPDWTVAEIYMKAKKKDKYDENIIFGNYQSLCKKPQGFFDMFDVVIIDECHHSKATSIKNILRKCRNCKYKIGLTGTFPAEGTYDNYVIQSFLGPVVYRMSSFDLINRENFATPVYVSSINLKYLPEETKNALFRMRQEKDKDDPQAGAKLLISEKEVMRDNPVRFNYICGMIKKTTKNTLVIFSDIKTGYGRKVYQYIKETSDKIVFYIDGETKSSTREEMKAVMEEDLTGNTIIVASMGCFTEGIDIANVWNIFLIETTKSEITLAQLLGRGMRRFEGKDRTIMIDFVDDYRVPSSRGYRNENYLYKHGVARREIYKKRGFPLSIVEVDLINNQKLF